MQKSEKALDAAIASRDSLLALEKIARLKGDSEAADALVLAQKEAAESTAELTSELALANTTLVAHSALVSASIATTEKVQSDLLLAETSIKSNKTALTATDARLAVTDEKATATDARLTATDTHLTETDTRLMATDSRLTATDTRLTATDTHLTATDTRLTETTSRLTATDANLTATDARLTATDANLTATGTRLAETDNKVIALKVETTTSDAITNTQLAATNTKIALNEAAQETALATEIATRQRNDTTLTQQAEASAQATEARKAEIEANAQTSITSLQQLEVSLLATIQTNKVSALSALQQEIVTRTSQDDLLRVDVDNLLTQVNSLESVVTDQEEQITAVTEAIATNTADITILKAFPHPSIDPCSTYPGYAWVGDNNIRWQPVATNFMRVYQDTDLIRVLGSFQEQATAANNLQLSSAGNHIHPVLYGNHRFGRIDGGSSLDIMFHLGGANLNTRGTTDYAGNHKHSITSTDTETRPPNFAITYCNSVQP